MFTRIINEVRHTAYTFFPLKNNSRNRGIFAFRVYCFCSYENCIKHW